MLGAYRRCPRGAGAPGENDVSVGKYRSKKLVMSEKLIVKMKAAKGESESVKMKWR
jgi:hypothetical protein